MLDTLGMGMADLRQRLTPILPAELVPGALETAGIHGIVGRSGGRTALVTTRPYRAPHHPISDVGLIGGATCRCPAKCRWPVMACSSWVSSLSSTAMSSRSCGNRSRRVFYEYNLPHIVDPTSLAALAVLLEVRVEE
jgi:hypothetical protein